MLVTVPLAGGLSASDWARRHAAGEVPDRSPYGLHRLTDRGVDVRFASAGFGPGRSGRAAARLARAVRHRTDGYEIVEAAADHFRGRGADAVLAASIFHYGEHTVGEAKRFMADQGISVRL